MFLAACSTAPKLTLRPQQTPSAAVASDVRYPEVVRAYHVGRYADPNDDLVMHEQHVIYRVEENDRWNLHPGPADRVQFNPPCNSAFSPTPVNDAVLAEVNAQRLATVQMMAQARTLSSALAQFQAALQQTRISLQETAVLRAAVIQMKKRLDALEAAQAQPSLLSPPNFPTNEPPDSLSP